MTTLASWLRTGRWRRGLSVAATARAADVNTQTVQTAELGRSVPAPETLEALCRVLDLDLRTAEELRMAAIAAERQRFSYRKEAR